MMMTRQWSNDSLIIIFRKKMLSGVNFKWAGMKNWWRRRSWDFCRYTYGHNNWTCACLFFCLFMWFSPFLNRFKHRRRGRTCWGKKYCSATRDIITWSKMMSKTHNTTSSLSLIVLKEWIIPCIISKRCGYEYSFIYCWSTQATRTDVTGNKNAFNKIGCLHVENFRLQGPKGILDGFMRYKKELW